MKCPICGTEMRHRMTIPGDWRKPDVDVSFPLLTCKSDHFSKIDFDHEKLDLGDFYRLSSYYTQTKTQADTSNPLLFRIIGKIAHSVDRGLKNVADTVSKLIKPGAAVLDVGAGAGGFMQTMHQRGFEVEGIEPDSSARSRNDDFPLAVHEASAENMHEPLEGKVFDLVTLSHVFEHVVDPEMTAQSIRKITRDGSVLYIEVPNCDSLDFQIAPLNWQHLGVPRHLNFWTETSLTRFLEQQGFEIVESGFRYYARQFAYSWTMFGKPMIGFFKDKGAYGFSPKSLTGPYQLFLLAATMFSSRRRKYDSLYVIARRKSS